MPWLVGLLALTVAAPPDAAPTVVLVGRRTAVPAPQGRALAGEVSKALEVAGVPMAMQPEVALSQLSRLSVKDTASCNGKRACLAELGRQLKVQWVVLLSIASIDKELSIGLELLHVDDETVVETDSLLLPRKAHLEGDALDGFAQRLKTRLLPPAPVVTPVAETPKPVVLTPAPPEPPLVAPEPAPRTHTAALVLGGGAVAALLAGATMFILGLVARGPLTAGEVGADGRVRSTLSFGEAAKLNADTTPLVFAGIGALVAGLGLGAGAVVTW